MGNAESSEHSSHFRPPPLDVPPPPPPSPDEDEEPEHLINISNKMVERLVEDKEIYKENAPKTQNDHSIQDKVLIERLRSIDEKHSERIGILPEALEALVGRIQARAAKIAKLEPVCGDCEAALLDCYNNNNDKSICYDEVTKFKNCVKEQTTLKLRSRLADMEDEQVRKNRDLEKARKCNLWGNRDPLKGKA